MKILFLLIALIFFAQDSLGQWIKRSIDTKASLRGLSVVSERVVWASGTGGTVIRTVDGGQTWNVITVPEAEKLDFRDIEAFDAHTAYVMSIGNGEASRIYKTTDGGATWKLQFKNGDPKAFFDAIACWDRNNCMAMSDPVKNKYVLIATTDGENWKEIGTDKMAYSKEGEAAFAASGTCLITQGKKNVFLVSGGSDARVFRSDNRGLTWFVSDTPMAKGSAGSGVFSIAMLDEKNGVIVGGNYEKPDETNGTLAFTRDGGRSWTAGSGLTGYRSAAAYINSKTIVAVGTNGTDITSDGGRSWKKLGSESLNALAAHGSNAVWAVGPNGRVVSMSLR
jgi:photosystem II stability/assembly factor-like uncharacterized protein